MKLVPRFNKLIVFRIIPGSSTNERSMCNKTYRAMCLDIGCQYSPQRKKSVKINLVES